MTPDSPHQSESARQIEADIRHAIAAASQVSVARALGVSESTVSRLLKEQELPWLASILSAAGLKVVGANEVTYPPEYIESLRHLARIAVSAPADVALEWIK